MAVALSTEVTVMILKISILVRIGVRVPSALRL
jgi:hypothetical protein